MQKRWIFVVLSFVSVVFVACLCIVQFAPPPVQRTLATRHQGDAVFAGEVQNILVRLQGRAADGAVLLMAHYDTVPTSPGAADNGAGVAVLLEIMRALRSSTHLKHDVIGLFTDGEEPAVLGAHAFASEHPWMADVRVALNLDGFGKGPAVLWSTGPRNGWLVREWARSVRRPASASWPLSKFISGENDLLAFLKADVTAAHFMSMYSFPPYHTSADRPGIIDPAAIQQIGSQFSAFVRRLSRRRTFLGPFRGDSSLR